MKIAPSVIGHVKRGFTLIELLVVIAIIGILSSVVLASLTTARNKGTDAKIQSEIRAISVNAEIYYDSNSSSYGTAASTCTTGLFAATSPNISQIITDLTAASSATDPVCYSSATAWAVQHVLVASTTQRFCMDSTGKVTTTNTLITAAACP